jgi:prepilin-type N-terminal cleavage/methylation domain-containing protein
MTRPRQRGFTLVETLVALILVSAVALPASLWLYRSRTHAAAWERFRAVQALEDRMNRAVLLRADRDWSGEDAGTGLRLEIRAEEDGAERRLIGTAEDRRGKVLVTLEAALFERGGR